MSKMKSRVNINKTSVPFRKLCRLKEVLKKGNQTNDRVCLNISRTYKSLKYIIYILEQEGGKLYKIKTANFSS